MALYTPQRDDCSIMRDLDGFPCSIFGPHATDDNTYIVAQTFGDNACANFFLHSAAWARRMSRSSFTGTCSIFCIKAWGTKGYK